MPMWMCIVLCIVTRCKKSKVHEFHAKRPTFSSQGAAPHPAGAQAPDPRSGTPSRTRAPLGAEWSGLMPLFRGGHPVRNS